MYTPELDFCRRVNTTEVQFPFDGTRRNLYQEAGLEVSGEVIIGIPVVTLSIRFSKMDEPSTISFTGQELVHYHGNEHFYQVSGYCSTQFPLVCYLNHPVLSKLIKDEDKEQLAMCSDQLQMSWSVAFDRFTGNMEHTCYFNLSSAFLASYLANPALGDSDRIPEYDSNEIDVALKELIYVETIKLNFAHTKADFAKHYSFVSEHDFYTNHFHELDFTHVMHVSVDTQGGFLIDCNGREEFSGSRKLVKHTGWNMEAINSQGQKYSREICTAVCQVMKFQTKFPKDWMIEVYQRIDKDPNQKFLEMLERQPGDYIKYDVFYMVKFHEAAGLLKNQRGSDIALLDINWYLPPDDAAYFDLILRMFANRVMTNPVFFKKIN